MKKAEDKKDFFFYFNKDKFKIDQQLIKALFTSRSFHVGSYSTFASIVVIAIAIVIMMCVSAIPSQYTKFDVTKNDLFTISDQTEKLVSGLKDEVDIYLLAQSGKEDATLLELLNRYKDFSGKIKVSVKDPVVYPNFAQQYTSDAVYNNSIVVVCGERSQYISYYDIYVSDYSDYYSNSGLATTEFNGESCLTSAIDYVTNENLPKIYILSGHGEQSLNSVVENAIAKENIKTESLNLLSTATVPEDAECLVISSPASDISTAEKDVILKYLESGGNLLLITNYSDKDMPDLAALMAYYGVKTVDGLVFEGDSSHCVNGYNHYLLPNINDHTITSPLLEKGYNVLMPIAQGIVKLNDYRDTVTITNLLTTSDKAFAKADGYNITTMEKEAGDLDGPFSLGIAITETVNSGDASKKTKGETNILWYTTGYMLDDSVNQMVSGANLDLFINSLDWMCEREGNISIHSKRLSDEHLTMTSVDSSFWSLMMVGVIPVVFLVLGIMVRRKRR